MFKGKNKIETLGELPIQISNFQCARKSNNKSICKTALNPCVQRTAFEAPQSNVETVEELVEMLVAEAAKRGLPSEATSTSKDRDGQASAHSGANDGEALGQVLRAERATGRSDLAPAAGGLRAPATGATRPCQGCSAGGPS